MVKKITNRKLISDLSIVVFQQPNMRYVKAIPDISRFIINYEYQDHLYIIITDSFTGSTIGEILAVYMITGA